jgi:hypothetical protein
MELSTYPAGEVRMLLDCFVLFWFLNWAFFKFLKIHYVGSVASFPNLETGCKDYATGKPQPLISLSQIQPPWVNIGGFQRRGRDQKGHTLTPSPHMMPAAPQNAVSEKAIIRQPLGPGPGPELWANINVFPLNSPCLWSFIFSNSEQANTIVHLSVLSSQRISNTGWEQGFSNRFCTPSVSSSQFQCYN